MWPFCTFKPDELKAKYEKLFGEVIVYDFAKQPSL